MDMTEGVYVGGPLDGRMSVVHNVEQGSVFMIPTLRHGTDESGEAEVAVTKHLYEVTVNPDDDGPLWTFEYRGVKA